MKCYYASPGSITSGFYVLGHEKRRFVRINTGAADDPSEVVAFFSDRLTEKLREGTCGGLFGEPQSLLECDIEKRSDLWLDIPSEERRNQALVLASVSEWCNPKVENVSWVFSPSDSNCEVFAEYVLEKHKVGHYRHVLNGCAILMRMAPGGRVTIQRKITTTRFAAVRLWTGGLKKLTSKTTILAYDAAGNLSWPKS